MCPAVLKIKRRELFVMDLNFQLKKVVLPSFFIFLSYFSLRHKANKSKQITTQNHMKTITLLIQAFLIAVLSTYVAGHQCDHDFHQTRIGKVVPAIQQTHHHHAHPLAVDRLRIVADYSNVYDPTKVCTKVGDVRTDFQGGTYTCTSDQIVTSAKIAYMKDTLMAPALAYLSSALSVNQVPQNLSVSGATCDSALTIPQAHMSYGVPNTDLVLYVTIAASSSASTLAWALYCATDTAGRPIVGHVNWNPNVLDPLAARASNQTNINTAIHEIMHVLGFSKSYVDEYFPTKLNATKVVFKRGKNVTMVVTSEVIQKSREYYGCSTMEGLELEDQGGTGTALSHWEKRLVGPEAMSGVTYSSEIIPTISNMTLAFFKDSGKYQVNYAAADNNNLFFGRNKGCPFVNEKCNASSVRDSFC